MKTNGKHEVIARIAIGLIFMSTILLGSCSNSGEPTVTLSFPGGSAVAIDNGQTITINVATTNDSGAGVTWACSGTACPNPLASPAWVTTNTSVTITVSSAGTATITATSIKQTTISKSVTVTVNAVLALPSTAAIQALLTADPATVGSNYTFTFTATGGTAPLTWTWSLTSATSDGLSLSSGGVVAGMPASAETLTFTVTVTDSSAADASFTSGLVTLQALNLVTLTSISVSPSTRTVAQGQPVAYTATGYYSDGSNGNITSTVTWTSSSSATPAPVYMNPAGIAVTLATGSSTVTNSTVAATLGTVTGTAPLTVDPPFSRFAYIADPGYDAISVYAVNSNSTQTQFIPRGYSLAENAFFPQNNGSVDAIILEPTGHFAYIFNGASNEIDQLIIDPVGGGLTASQNPAVSPGNVFNAGLVDPTGRYLYALIWNVGLVAYSIDQAAAGALEPLNGGNAYLPGIDLATLITDPTGQFLYASSATGGVYAFSINSDGTLAPLNGSLPYTAPGDEGDGSMAIDRLNNLYVVTNGTSVSVWPINYPGGTLGTVSPFPIPSGVSGIETLAIDPSGTHIYVIASSESNPLTTYQTVDFATLPLSSSTTWTPGPSLSPGLNGANDYTIPVTPMGMTIDPGGNFLVVYTAEPDIAFLFAIAPSTGALTAEAPVPTLIDGYSLALSIGTSAPVVSAASAFAANEEAPGTISTYTILSGALTAGSTVPGVEGNSLLAADPFGRYLYALSPPFDELYSYSMTAATGGLAPLTNPTSSFTTTPTSLVAEPSGQYVYVAAGGMYYGFSNSSTTSLLAISGSPFTGPASPTTLAVDPAGLQVFGLGSSGIDSMSIVPLTGQLVHNSTYSVSGQFAAAAVDSSGQFLFALDNQNEEIRVFYIYSDQFRDGWGSITELTPTSSLNGSSTMSSIAVDPLDRFIVVGDQNGAITTFSFNLSTNVLTLSQQVFPGSPGEMPIGQMAIDPTGSYFFTVQLGDPAKSLAGRVLTYSIGPDGTMAPPSDTVTAWPDAGLATTGLALGITTK